jgi:peptidyl-prolyl cis-trans isomerase SurA
MLTRSTRVGLAALLVAGSTFTLSAGEVIEQVLVRVNGEIITKTDFEQRQVGVLRQRPELASGSATNEDVKRAIEEVTPDLILSAVDELLFVQRGKELGFMLGDQQFAELVENIKKENQIEEDADFEAALQQENMTLEDLRRSFERQMLVSRVQQQEVADKIGVTEAEARAYHSAHRAEFTTISEITLREILIAVPVSDAGVNVAEDEEARAKAENIHSRLVAGEPFARLAADLSEAPSKANGGLIGPFMQTDVAPALQKIVAPLNVGELSPVIRSATGYQILKLESRTEENVKSFEAARGEISDRMSQEKHAVQLLVYLDRLRDQAIIMWRNEELRTAYEQALAKRREAASEPGA